MFFSLRKVFFSIIIGLTVPLLAMQDPMQRDPYQNIRYQKAFDQKDLYRQYKSLMEKLGCAKNVFPNAGNKEIVLDIENEPNGYQQLPSNSDSLTKQELISYQKACLQCLQNARRLALAEPGIYAVTEMLLSSAGAAITLKFLGNESMGGSFAAFAAIFDCLRLLRGTIQSGHRLISNPDNPLAMLEESFAKNKCFIPRSLWQKIITSFVAARQNEFSREAHTNFLNFALGFTIYKPKPAIKCKGNRSIDEIKEELERRINQFFADYKKDSAFDDSHLKINLAKFIDSLGNRNASTQAPRYIYLHGTGGIGKTHFVQTLSQWIDELLPSTIHFEELVINSAAELEGSAEQPGAFLRLLRNQLLKNRRGSVVMIDEATWLNDQGMISSAKRIFNGDRSHLSTAYFGTGIDGTGTKLDMPPMLIFVASNEKIQDPALASRFDTIFYPTPTKQALVAHAFEIMRKSKQFSRSLSIDEELIDNWIDTLEEKDRNFRYIGGNVEAFFFNKQS